MTRYTNSDGNSEGQAQQIAKGSPNVDLLAIELRILTSNIHAVFLFEDRARDLLRKLCLMIGTAAEGKVYFNWKHFSDHLKVPDDVARNIGNWLKPSGGPIEHLLLAHVQYRTSMLDRVIYALQKLKREDIILKINEDIRELVVGIHNRPELKDAEGIYRLADRPSVPLILEAESSSTEDSRNNDDSCRISYATDEDNNGKIEVTREKKRVALTVLLTCARDGAEAEERIAKKLRALKPKIGVVVLREQQEHLWKKRRVFILDCIKQVDVIMPILTKGYMDAINGRTPNNGVLSMFDADQQYVKYIYETMSNEYQDDKCSIKRIRCILPNNTSPSIIEINPEIRVYFGEVQLEEFIDLILRAKRKKLRKQKEEKSCNELIITV